MTVAFMTIDAGSTNLGPLVETVRLFPHKDAAIAWFDKEYAPENTDEEEDWENSAPMGWHQDDLNQLRETGTADSGGDIYYVIKEVDE